MSNNVLLNKMQLYDASVPDILRCCQRDSSAVNELQDYIQAVLKLFLKGNDYNLVKKNIHAIAGAWYYLMTSVSNLQTLGEEYTGIIRIARNGQIPSRTLELIWLILYVGGEPLLERLLKYVKTRITNSDSLENRAKNCLCDCLRVVEENKETLMRIHYSLFYISGKYYNISNRASGIKYVLVRQWLQNDTFSQSFRFLGRISLFYMLYSVVQRIWNGRNNEDTVKHKEVSSVSRKFCALCCENRKSSCVTPCGHIYCWDCIYDSLSYQQYCPLCRETINPSRIVFLQNYI